MRGSPDAALFVNEVSDNRRAALLFGALLLAAGACCLSTARAEGPHWSYKGHGGPSEWGGLDQEFATCKSGKLQSPVDIRGAWHGQG